jgi:hypothetical protein
MDGKTGTPLFHLPCAINFIAQKRISLEPVNCYFYAGKILWVDSRDIPGRLIIIVNLFCISMNEFFCSRSLNVSG